MYCFTFNDQSLNDWFFNLEGRKRHIYTLSERDRTPPSARGTVLLTPLRKEYGNRVGVIGANHNPWVRMFIWLRARRHIYDRKKYVFDGLCSHILWFERLEDLIHFRLNDSLQEKSYAKPPYIYFKRSFRITNQPADFWQWPKGLTDDFEFVLNKSLDSRRRKRFFEEALVLLKKSNLLEDSELDFFQKELYNSVRSKLNILDADQHKANQLIRLYKKKLVSPVSNWSIMPGGEKNKFNTDKLLTK